jgi:predicted DCC family thiol-disulfide oxidoreductase YuxK
MKALKIIYDGQCIFCAHCIRVLKKLDILRAFQFYDSHDRDSLSRRFPMVEPETAEEAMLAVTEKGVVFQGFYAFRRLVWGSPWLWLTAPLFYFPGSSFFGTRFYAWVARRRKKFGCRAESGES